MGLAVFALLTHLYSVKNNPGDSGESAIVMMPFCLPWIALVPKDVVYSKFWAYGAYFFYVVAAGTNALILYCVFGGWNLKK